MSKNSRILIIDDQPANRKLLKGMLEADGYDVSLAESGEEGLAMVRVVRPDAVLLDVMMPDLSGIDATRILKSNADTEDVPVIIVTSLQDKATRHQALEVGAEDFLCRPLDSHELRSRLRNLVRLKKLSDQVRSINTHLEDTVQQQTARLAASEAFLRASLDAMTALVAIVDAHMRIVAVNASWRDYLDRNPKGHSSHGVGKIYSAEMLGVDQQVAYRFREGIERIRRGEIATYTQELQSQRTNWEMWFLAQAASFGVDGGDHIVITHQDITLQKLAESDLEDREYEWRTLVETTPALILRLSRDGRVHFTNRDLSDIGLAEDGLIYSLLHEDDREDLQIALAQCLRDDHKLEVRVRMRGVREEYRTWQLSMGPVSQHLPNPFVIAVAIDVTEHVRAEEELKESNRRFRQLASASREGLLFLSSSRKIVDANSQAAALLGRTLDEIRNSQLDDLLGEEIASEVWSADGPVSTFYDRELISKAGAATHVDVTVSEIAGGRRGAEADRAVLAIALSDIGSRKEAQQQVRKLQMQLQQSQKMEALGQLAGGVAHDFNNLLTSIISFSGFVRDELPEGDPAREDIDEVLAAADRATGLTRQLLLFSRQRSVELQSVDVRDALQQIEKLLRRTIGVDIELVVRIEKGNMTILADPTQLDQVILNLVVNARDAMPSGGRVEIVASRAEVKTSSEPDPLQPGMYVKIEVRDTGVGMSPEVQQRIFEPFFTTKELNKGTGLGLATCYGVVKQLGGTIEVESAVGQGTTFTILIPEEANAGVTIARERVVSQDLRGTETILLIEDETTIRDAAVRTLEARGYRVLAAADAVEALKIFNANQFTIDAVFSDVLLPNGNGFEIAAEIRRRNPKLPILMTSGYAGDRAPENRDDYPILWKPYKPQELAERLRSCIDSTH